MLKISLFLKSIYVKSCSSINICLYFIRTVFVSYTYFVFQTVPRVRLRVNKIHFLSIFVVKNSRVFKTKSLYYLVSLLNYIGSLFTAMKLNRYVYKIIKRRVREHVQCLFNFFLLVEIINKTILLQELKTPSNSG